MNKLSCFILFLCLFFACRISAQEIKMSQEQYDKMLQLMQNMQGRIESMDQQIIRLKRELDNKQGKIIRQRYIPKRQPMELPKVERIRYENNIGTSGTNISVSAI